MRTLAAPVAVLVLLLAGCSSPAADGPTSSDFDDIDVQATSTTGILLGVVVDDAIRPVEGVDVLVTTPSGTELKAKTDDQGRFALGGLQPGAYLVKANHPSFAPVQTSTDVAAGVEDPPVVRIQLTRLFSEDPYTETIKFDGFIACAYAYGVSSTCVNDYTRLLGAVPGCEGGCLKDYNVSQTGGNIREFRFNLGPGWTSMVMEEAWEPTLGEPASKGTMGFIISFFNRTSTGHWWAKGTGASPLRVQLDVGKDGPDSQEADELIPPTGMNDLFVLFGAGDDDVAVNQGFQYFQTNFYYAIPPDGWALANGDTVPF